MYFDLNLFGKDKRKAACSGSLDKPLPRVERIAHRGPTNALVPLAVGGTILIPEQAHRYLVEAIKSIQWGRNARLTLLGTVGVASRESLSTGAGAARACRAILKRCAAGLESVCPAVREMVTVGHRPFDELIRVVRSEDIDLIILPYSAEVETEERGSATEPAADIVSRLLEDPPVAIMALRDDGHIRLVPAAGDTARIAPGERATATPAAPERDLIELRTSGRTALGAASIDRVDTWFAENSFHADEFSDIYELVRLKKRHNSTISLGLPTLNEEATVGSIINTFQRELQEKHPLLDELVVIDSGSSDSTVEIAKSYGVEVYEDRDVLPGWGSCLGKGGALWKSLYLMSGDIIVWVDTDIKNIHPRFVYGLVGPLLRYPSLGYVKGFYRRPVKIDNHYFETGGGRVTELTARPLINMFYPELSGLVQPLSGEYAGRRELLERVGFYNGYGVEIGLLIEILEKFGLDVIAQVDLIERIHRNQPLASLGKMSLAIMQVAMDKLVARDRLLLRDEVSSVLRSIRHDPQQFLLESCVVSETAKPPIDTIPEYRMLFKGESASGTPDVLQR